MVAAPAATETAQTMAAEAGLVGLRSAPVTQADRARQGCQAVAAAGVQQEMTTEVAESGHPLRPHRLFLGRTQ